MPDVAGAREDAEALDAADELAFLREAFALPAGVVYLDGNSLGALPRATVARLADVVEREWGDDLVRSWNRHAWSELPARVAALVAPLVGAAADEVAVADSTSVNLFKLLAGALRLRPGRRVILSEEENFPTDLY
ncbi:MAG: kynureninase, partial [Vicinamibacterales bacterium]